MNHAAIKKNWGIVGGTLAAMLAAATLFGTPAGAQERSLAAIPANQERPDPAIAKGLDVFSDKGELIGTLEEVVERDGRTVGILAVREWEIEPAQLVEVPYESISVTDGQLTYDVGSFPGDPISRGDPMDRVPWESLDARMDEYGE